MLSQLRHCHAARAFRGNDLTRWSRTCRPAWSIYGRQAPAAASTGVAGASQLQWSSYVSRRINLDLAVEEAVEEVLKDFQPDTPATVAIVFLSSAFVGEYDQVVAELRQRLPSLKVVWGSTGYGVIGTTAEGPEEIEHAPALSLALGHLPDVDLHVTRVTASNLPDGDASPDAWAQLLGVPVDEGASSSFLVLADPSFQRVEELLAGLDYAFPAASKIGGLTSAGKMSPVRAMFGWQEGQPEEDSVFRTGAVVLSMTGAVALELMVAQGCRPLTPYSYTVTRVQPGAAGGVLVLGLSQKGLDGGGEISPVEALGRDLQGQFSSKAELTSLLSNLALGVAPGGLRNGDALEPQDFLIRGVMLERSGHMLVMDTVRVGERIRFMVRGREGAMEDLKAHGLAYKRKQLAAVMEGRPAPRACGLLLFSCNGRGTNLYDEPSYDARTMGSFVRVPSSGFLCNGEIATVGGSTKLHGFTCAAAILQARDMAVQEQATTSGSSSSSGDSCSGSGGSSSSSSSSGSGGSSSWDILDAGTRQPQQTQQREGSKPSGVTAANVTCTDTGSVQEQQGRQELHDRVPSSSSATSSSGSDGGSSSSSGCSGEARPAPLDVLTRQQQQHHQQQQNDSKGPGIGTGTSSSAQHAGGAGAEESSG